MSSKELVAASTRPLLLAVLSQSESYGYAIIMKVTELSGGQLEWRDGMLYPVLHRLEKEGLIQSRWDTSESGRRRRYYCLTESGILAVGVERQRWESVDRTLRKAWREAFPPPTY